MLTPLRSRQGRDRPSGVPIHYTNFFAQWETFWDHTRTPKKPKRRPKSKQAVTRFEQSVLVFIEPLQKHIQADLSKECSKKVGDEA